MRNILLFKTNIKIVHSNTLLFEITNNTFKYTYHKSVYDKYLNVWDNILSKITTIRSVQVNFFVFYLVITH